MPFLAVLNGILRDFFYGKYLSVKTSHQISVVILIIILGVYIWIMLRKRLFKSLDQAVYFVAVWMVLTIVFEFIFFGLIMKKPFSDLVEAYNLLDGELWPLILIFLFAIPIILFKFSNRKQ